RGLSIPPGPDGNSPLVTKSPRWLRIWILMMCISAPLLAQSSNDHFKHCIGNTDKTSPPLFPLTLFVTSRMLEPLYSPSAISKSTPSPEDVMKYSILLRLLAYKKPYV
ncbi:hypothetical protein CLAIMM_00881, partial [Cladophialophora immunda]